VSSELCKTIAYEAVRRGARVNVSELWATLEVVDDVHPKVIVDLGSGRPVQWAWWSLGARVVGVSWAVEGVGPGFSGERLPESVTDLVADPREADTVLRVTDQVAGGPVDVLVLGLVGTEENARFLFHAYAPMVRPGGLVLVHGIADPRTPGVKAFWRSLNACGSQEMVGAAEPIGFGIVPIHGKDRTPHE
jgi:hypothetical protein